MASIPSIPTSGSLPASPLQPVRTPAERAIPAADLVSVPDVVVTSDQAVVRSGLEALSRVATTPLWSADFELPAPPPPPPLAKKAWDYASTPDITLNDAGGSASAPLEPMTGGPAAPWRWPAPAKVEFDEEEDGFDLLEFLAFPFQVVADGVQVGGEALHGAVDAVAQTVATGTHSVATAIESGLQHAVGAVGDLAANAWKSITNFRLW